MGRPPLANSSSLCGGIIARCLLATLCLAGTAPAEDVDHPDAAEVVGAYLIARAWVDSFAPPVVDDDAARVTIANASGVCVILRRAGRVLGVGHDERGDDRMLRRALGRALSQVLGDPAVAGLDRDDRDTIGTSLTLELDVAGRFIPQPGRTFDQIAARLDPGQDGLATRRGERWAILYPAQMRAMNTGGNLPHLLLGQVVELGFEALPLREIQARESITIYRFASVHLAQRDPAGFPAQTFRAGRLVFGADLDRPRLRRLGDDIVDHIHSTRWPDKPPEGFDARFVKPPGVKGDYRPVPDRYDPLLAPPREQALIAFALTRYARALGDDPVGATRALDLARSILSDLARATGSYQDEVARPVASAAVLYALCELDENLLTPELERARTDALTRTRSMLGPDGDFATTEDGPAISPHDMALLAGALARAGARGVPGAPDAPLLRLALDAAWSAVPPQRRVALLPWIGWGEEDLAHDPGQEAIRWDFLQELWEVLGASRLDAGSGDVPDDLDGGLALTGRAAGSTPRATAQSLRPASWMAGALGNPRLIDDDQFDAAVAQHLRTMRFLTQLTVQETSSWRYQSPERALGGVRAALWDTNQPQAAQALGLLTVAETLISLKRARASSQTPP